MSRKKYTVRFPLEIGKDDVGYKSEEDFKEVVKFNIKSTLLTCPGERISAPEFGVCLRGVIFEFPSNSLANVVDSRIRAQIRTYMPYITIVRNEIGFSPDQQKLLIKLTYRISEIQSVDTFETSVDLSQI